MKKKAFSQVRLSWKPYFIPYLKKLVLRCAKSITEVAGTFLSNTKINHFNKVYHRQFKIFQLPSEKYSTRILNQLPILYIFSTFLGQLMTQCYGAIKNNRHNEDCEK